MTFPEGHAQSLLLSRLYVEGLSNTGPKRRNFIIWSISQIGRENKGWDRIFFFRDLLWLCSQKLVQNHYSVTLVWTSIGAKGEWIWKLGVWQIDRSGSISSPHRVGPLKDAYSMAIKIQAQCIYKYTYNLKTRGTVSKLTINTSR